MTSMCGPTRRRKRSRLRQVDLHQLVEELVGALGFTRQKHEEVIVPIEPLAQLEQVAAEKSNDRPVGLLRGAPARLH